MRLMVDTNVIVSPLVDDEFAGDSTAFFERARSEGHTLLISPIVLSELYTWVFLDPEPRRREGELRRFLRVARIRVVTGMPREVVRRAGELYAQYLKRGGRRRRILPDFLIGAYAERFSDAFITWNPGDFRLRVPVKTPTEFLRGF